MKNISKYIVFNILFFLTISFSQTNNITKATNVKTTNKISFLTNNVYTVPYTDKDYAEVKKILQKDIFRDVYEKESESALRRFEIEFFISLPPILILNTLFLKIITSFENEYIGGEFDITRNIYLYTSSILIAGSIAYNDYKKMKLKKEKQGISWNLFKKKF